MGFMNSMIPLYQDYTILQIQFKLVVVGLVARASLVFRYYVNDHLVLLRPFCFNPIPSTIPILIDLPLLKGTTLVGHHVSSVDFHHWFTKPQPCISSSRRGYFFEGGVSLKKRLRVINKDARGVC
ncbi:hypothetical protein QL285_008512 [Trifolium repens]|nr:hypothetical protein QL285_008512 [Trifolium repens]